MAAALVGLVLLAVLLSPRSAMAGVSGQIGDAWGPAAELEGEELIDPSQVAVDPSDGSVFIAAVTGEFTETVVRKYSSDGELKGSMRLPGNKYVGLAVDPKLHRLYVLEGLQSGATREATKILAFSTSPTGEKLEPAVPSELPVPTGGAALLNPQEIVVDPSTDDLVVVAREEQGATELTALQRIDVDPLTGVGTLGEKFIDEETLHAPGIASRNFHAIAINKAGVTYVLASHRLESGLSGFGLAAQSLPADFSASSSLTAVPGFDAAAGNPIAGRPLISTSQSLTGRGPQVAVSTSASGEDTLYWKVEAEEHEILVESYAVDGETRAGVLGGGTEEGECRIASSTTALAGLENGNLSVFDQGTLISEPGEPVEFFPVSYQFGLGGSGCPAAVPGFKLEAGGQTVTTVTSGSTVTFNGAETELNGAALEAGTWKVEGPEEFTEPNVGPALSLSHKFETPGNYTIRLTIEAGNASHPVFGTKFAAQPRTLEVTQGSGLPTPTVTGVSPAEGPTAGGTLVTITGTELTGATEVKFGGTGVVCQETEATCKVIGDTEIKATTPALTAGAVDVHVVTGAGESPVNAPADHFTAVAPVVPKFTLTVAKAGPGLGAVISSPVGINCGGTCAASFNEHSSVTLTASAAAGSTFAGWGGACAGAGSCVVLMDAAKSVTATFNANPPAEEHKTPVEETKPPANEVKPPPTGGTVQPTPKPKTKAEILAEKRKAALKKCQKLKGKTKTMCVKKANQVGKPKKNKKGSKKGK